ncbi:TetR/AcrR family transcriptional regulator [Streptomyces daliensis]
MQAKTSATPGPGDDEGSGSASTRGAGPAQAGTAGKAGYHHGDLRNALTEAATALAREGGPEAVVLRAAARRVGVSPTAAYRHFAGQAELLHAVKERGQWRLAEFMAQSMGEPEGGGGDGGGGAPDAPDPAEVVRRVRVMGHGYVAFARAEPGLFRAAFCHEPLTGESGPTATGLPDFASGEGWEFSSFGLLVQAMDDLVACGLMPAHRRPGAEITAWGMTHGLAMLFLDGPLSELAPEQIDGVVEHALSVTIAGLTAP